MKMSYRERKLIHTFRKLSDNDQENLYEFALALLNESSADSDSEKRQILKILSSILATGRSDLKPSQKSICYCLLMQRTVDYINLIDRSFLSMYISIILFWCKQFSIYENNSFLNDA